MSKLALFVVTNSILEMILKMVQVHSDHPDVSKTVSTFEIVHTIMRDCRLLFMGQCDVCDIYKAYREGVAHSLHLLTTVCVIIRSIWTENTVMNRFLPRKIPDINRSG